MTSVASAVAHQAIAAAGYRVVDCNRVAGYMDPARRAEVDCLEYQCLPAGNNRPAADYMVAHYLVVHLAAVMKTNILAHIRWDSVPSLVLDNNNS